MNKVLVDELRRELMRVIQKYAGWMSEEQLIELARQIGLAVDETLRP